MGTLTITMMKVFTSPFWNTLSSKSLAKFFSPTNWPNMVVSFMLLAVRLVKIQMNMGMMTNPTKKIRLGSMNR